MSPSAAPAPEIGRPRSSDNDECADERATRHAEQTPDLVELLHQGASADEFARRLALLDTLPPDDPAKPALVETVRMAMAVRNRLELHQERERGLLAVIESAQDLSSRLDLQGLLRAIVSRARNLLGSDVAWLTIYDAEAGEFRVLVVDGALSQKTSFMVARRDRGVVSIVMSTRLPFTTPDYLHDRRIVHDPKLDDTFREEGIAALVGVPLIWVAKWSGCCSSPIATTARTRRRALDPVHAGHLRRRGAEERARLRARQRGARARRPGARRARAPPAQHPGRHRCARADHVAAGARRVAGHAVPVGGAALGGSILVLDEAGLVVSRGIAAGYDGAAGAGSMRRTASTRPN